MDIFKVVFLNPDSPSFSAYNGEVNRGRSVAVAVGVSDRLQVTIFGHVTRDMWHVTFEIRHLTFNI